MRAESGETENRKSREERERHQELGLGRGGENQYTASQAKENKKRHREYIYGHHLGKGG